MSANDAPTDTPPRPPRSVVKTSSEPPKLASFMVTNIIMLVVVCGASILLLLFGDFDGKAVRTITTLVLFAIFTLFAALDASRDKPQRYISISQIGHIYMLSMGLVLIWGSLAVRRGYFDEFSIMTKTILIVALVKVGVVVVQRISDYLYSSQPQLSLAARFSTYSLALTTILYTLPIGTDFFITFGEGYWKLAVAVLLFAGLSISVTVLLAWYLANNEPVKETRPATRPDLTAPTVPAGPSISQEQRDGSDGAKFFNLDEEMKSAPVEAQPTVTATSVPVASPSPAQGPRYAPAGAGTIPAEPPVYARPVAGPQSWPVFPNGQPLPAMGNGRPDYGALQYVASIHAEAERQWFAEGKTRG